MKATIKLFKALPVKDDIRENLQKASKAGIYSNFSRVLKVTLPRGFIYSPF